LVTAGGFVAAGDGGVDYRPGTPGAYLPEADLGKLKRFSGVQHHSFAPILDVPVDAWQ